MLTMLRVFVPILFGLKANFYFEDLHDDHELAFILPFLSLGRTFPFGYEIHFQRRVQLY